MFAMTMFQIYNFPHALFLSIIRISFQCVKWAYTD